MLVIDETEFDRQVGQRLREARMNAGVRVETLAATTGLSEATVRAHERGTRSISAPLALQYALLLAVTPGWLLFGELAPQLSGRAPAAAGESRTWRSGERARGAGNA